jgi:Phosphotyrosyl phosphate activator (PTPA) protein
VVLHCIVQLLLREGDDWMYLGAVAFTRSLKQGAPFAECCPMLNDISGQLSWKKVSVNRYKSSYKYQYTMRFMTLTAKC